jgi:hypothetical protein
MQPRRFPSAPTEPEWSSPEIDKLAKALAKAQAEIKDAETDAENPHFRSAYATLASCWASARAPLSKNGLAITQLTRLEDGVIMLDTLLLHGSGQWVRSTYPVKPEKPTPQGLGSALTYAKRYSLCSVCGVSPAGEDDDGNAASPAPPARKRAPAPQQPTDPAVDAAFAATEPPAKPPTGGGPPWLDDPLGFGKHKAKTWRHFLDGVKDGPGQDYLEWLVQQTADTPRQQEQHRRASSVIDMRAAQKS